MGVSCAMLETWEICEEYIVGYYWMTLRKGEDTLL
jgi:hypothetical protein